MLSLLDPTKFISRLSRPRKRETPPTVIHVTHWKAGSQWLYKILLDCVGDRVVRTEMDVAHFLKQPVQTGMIYPAVYLTKQQFDSVLLPADSQRFVIIRDLRDTLISWYFSMKVSHPEIHSVIGDDRIRLNSLTEEEGLLSAISRMRLIANIQLSWVEAGEPVIRYEDLLERDEAILQRVLLEQCQLPITRERLREVLQANRFEQSTGGRPRGQEDIHAHHRKGIAGDWRNHFTPRVTEAFKARYGNLLVATGYERDLNW